MGRLFGIIILTRASVLLLAASAAGGCSSTVEYGVATETWLRFRSSPVTTPTAIAAESPDGRAVHVDTKDIVSSRGIPDGARVVVAVRRSSGAGLVTGGSGTGGDCCRLFRPSR